MRVKLKRTWFAPDISGHTATTYVGRNGRPVARGHRLRKGIHEVPSEWRALLPPDAVVLDDDDFGDLDDMFYDEAMHREPQPDDLVKGDIGHAAAEQMRAIEQQVEEDDKAKLKAQRIANLAKARAAKAEKQENKANA